MCFGTILQPLTPSAKVKPPSQTKKAQFSLSRRSRKSVSPGAPLVGSKGGNNVNWEYDDAWLLCPWNENLPILALPEDEACDNNNIDEDNDANESLTHII